MQFAATTGTAPASDLGPHSRPCRIATIRHSSEEKAMRSIKLLADVAGQRVFADFGTFVLERLVRSAERRTRHR